MVRKLLLILLGLSLIGCLGSKKVTEQSSEIAKIEKTTSVTDSISSEVVNKAINDKASVKVIESDTGDRNFDEAVNKAVTNILSSINFEKSSGDNSYKMYYDINDRMMKMEASIGETSDTEVATSNEVESEKSISETSSTYTKETFKIIPWWFWIVVIVLMRKHIIGLIAIFIPGVKEIKTIQDLLNPPSKKNN